MTQEPPDTVSLGHSLVAAPAEDTQDQEPHMVGMVGMVEGTSTKTQTFCNPPAAKLKTFGYTKGLLPAIAGGL